MKEDIVIKQMQKSDDARQAAQLVYGTAPDLFRALLGRREKAVSKIVMLLPLEDNIFSYRNLLIAVKGRDIKGILIGYNVESVCKEKMKKDLKQTLSLFARLRFWMIIHFSRHIMDFEGIDGGYIQNLCVGPACRGEGIGRRLLEHYIAGCGREGIKDVYLDVEGDNETAVNLYKKTGFEIFRTTNIKIAGVTLYRMRRIV